MLRGVVRFSILCALVWACVCAFAGAREYHGSAKAEQGKALERDLNESQPANAIRMGWHELQAKPGYQNEKSRPESDTPEPSECQQKKDGSRDQGIPPPRGGQANAARTSVPVPCRQEVERY